MLKPMSRTPVTEEVANRIRTLITSGKVPVGGKLPPEYELVKVLEVSRSTIREVLITLQAEGYIEIRRGKGAFVIDKAEFDRKKFIEWYNHFNIQELLEVRMAIEPMAASLASQRISEKEIDHLQLIYIEFKKAVEEQRLDEVVKGDELFHQTIIQASKNELLKFLYSNFIPLLHEYRSRAFYPPANPYLAIEAHGKILQAIKERDAEAASHAMLLHIRGSQEDVVGAANKIFSSQSSPQK